MADPAPRPVPHPECAWCSRVVEPLPRNVTGQGFTYPHDADGDITCAECLALPGYHVPMGRA
jgi:hypothetical protein